MKKVLIPFLIISIPITSLALRGRDFIKMGDEQMKKGNYRKALYFYKRAVEVEKKGYFYSKLGRAYEKLKQYDKAEDTYLKMIKLEPDKMWGYYNLAKLYLKQKKYALAIKKSEEALKYAVKKKEKARCYSIIGTAQWKMGKVKDAQATFKKAYDECKTPHLLYYYWKFLRKTNQTDKAAKIYSELQKDYPDSKYAKRAKRKIFGEKGKKKKSK